jgi:hypothetical protein
MGSAEKGLHLEEVNTIPIPDSIDSLGQVRTPPFQGKSTTYTLKSASSYNDFVEKRTNDLFSFKTPKTSPWNLKKCEDRDPTMQFSRVPFDRIGHWNCYQD